MILPIVAYGATVLRKVCKPIEANYEGLGKLIEEWGSFQGYLRSW